MSPHKIAQIIEPIETEVWQQLWGVILKDLASKYKAKVLSVGSTLITMMSSTSASYRINRVMNPYRRRGIHGALIAERIKRASQLGCDWVTGLFPNALLVLIIIL